MTEKRSPRLLVVADDYTGHSDAWPVIRLIESATDEEWSKLVEDIERTGRVVWEMNDYDTVTALRDEETYLFDAGEDDEQTPEGAEDEE